MADTPDPKPDAKLSLATVGIKTKDAIIGSWLMAVYFLAVGTSIFVLGSYQIQSRLKSIDIDGSSISIWRLDELSTVLDGYKSNIDDIDSKISNLREIYAEIEVNRRKADKKYDALFDDFEVKLDKLDAQIRGKHPNHVFSYKDAATSINVTTIFDRFEKDIASLSLADEDQVSIVEIKNLVSSGSSAYRRVNSIKKTREAINGQINQKIMDRDGLIDKLKSGIVRFDPTYENYSVPNKILLQNMVSEFVSLKSSLSKSIYKLILIPQELLVLLLVLAMGALGSTVFITQIFFRPEQKEPGILFYFSRPFFGAIIALSIFVLAKGGVLFLTDAADSGTRPALSPFFISFIAIVSGLMSEQAILTIRKAGDRWFGQQDVNNRRWAVNVAKVLSENQRDEKQFAELIGIDLKQLRDWIEQKEPVPLDMQKHIAIWLETKPRDLFTDIAPDNKVDSDNDKPDKQPA